MIKWGLFLKSLKQLFIISLISCFILLGSSFVNAAFDSIWYYYSANTNENYNFQWYTYFVNSDWNFETYNWWSTAKSFARNPIMENRNRIYNLWWINWNLYFYDYFYINNSIQLTQWFLDKWCVVPVSSRWTDKLHNNCSFNYTLNDIKWMVSNFTGYAFEVVWSVNPSWAWYDYTPLMFCFSDWENDYCVSCGVSSCPSWLTWSLDLDLWDFANISSYNWGKSPFWLWTSFIPSTWSRLWWRLITSSWYTNNQMIEAYECVWLQPYLCYWWFPITDIFEPWENFEDFTGYIAWQGATIFDLYNLYSGSFSNINQFLNTVLSRYQNWQINSFITEPKALLMLGSQMNVAWLKTSYISTYCDLLLNKNNNLTYTWNSIDDLRAQSCIRSQKINDSLKNSEWDDIVWQGSDVWIFGSGDDVDFDPETFFSNMMTKIESWLGSVSTWTAVGIIPWYIVIFTLALILIRMISH